MKNVKVMLAKFNNISVNFTKVEFNYKESLSEVSNIIRMQKNKDIDGLLGFWKIKDKQEYFELEHPVSSIKTKAFYNHQFGLFNYVFMIEVNDSSVAVDFLEDVERVISLIKNNI